MTNALQSKIDLTDHELSVLSLELAKRRSILTAYVLLFFLGGVGAHQFYIGNKFRGFVILLAWPAFFISMLGGVGHHKTPELLIFSCVWAFIAMLCLIYDWFTLALQTKGSNDDLESLTIKDLRKARPMDSSVSL